MKKISYIFPPLMAVMAMAAVGVQASQTVPKVVVNITIDQLRSDYMNAFAPLYGDRGFKLLLNEGKVYTHAQYPQTNLNRAACIATLATGTVPYDHGIVNEKWLDRRTLRPIYCVDDEAHPGLLTAEKASPAALNVSTFSDELKVASEGKSIVYSIAPFKDAAVLGAGHAADGAFWINRLTGRWCSTDYYSATMPNWALEADRNNLLDELLKKTTWWPISLLGTNYNYFLSGGEKKPFEYKFKGDHRFTAFTTSGLVNEYVSDFTLQCVNGTDIGKDDITDYIAVTFYAGNYEHKPVAESPMEIQDTYVRLDMALAKLIEGVAGKVGKDHMMIVVTSTGYCEEEPSNLQSYRIPTGTFYMNRTASLLNMYLGAIYGNGSYIEACLGNEIYLNHKLLENKQLRLDEVLARCEEILLQSDGVKDVYTSKRLQQGAWTPGISKFRNSYNPKNSGDIMVQVSPGWRLYNEDSKDNRIIRESYIPFPIIFYGNNIVNTKIETPVTTDCIAPTLAQVIRIRAPNACSTASLIGFE